MNLEHLRTPNPLTEFDYAAVRARVHAELARKRRPWLMMFRFAAAFAAAVLVVLAMIPVEPAQAPSGVRRRQSPLFLPPQPVRAATSVAALQTVHRKRRRPARKETTAVARIEIHTADPDIRIIWIVPKENS
jgi:hypothetical protein